MSVVSIIEEKTKAVEEEEPGAPTSPLVDGKIYRNCKVTGVHDFGIVVEVVHGYEGLVHASRLDIGRVSCGFY